MSGTYSRAEVARERRRSMGCGYYEANLASALAGALERAQARQFAAFEASPARLTREWREERATCMALEDALAQVRRAIYVQTGAWFDTRDLVDSGFRGWPQ